MSDRTFIQDVDRHVSCLRSGNGFSMYSKECESDSFSVWVFIGLALVIIGFSILAGSVIVRVVDARARRQANLRMERGDEEEADLEPYRDGPNEDMESGKVFDEEKQLL